MAVYTQITTDELNELLENYPLNGDFELQEIAQGIENTNYFLIGKEQKYVLTIFEKRVNEEELPFFFELMNHLSQKNILCPTPIVDNNKNFINYIKNKPCAITSFLNGKSITTTSNFHIEQLGTNIAKLHLASEGFAKKRQNNLSYKEWPKQFNKIIQNHPEIKSNSYSDIKEELNWITSNWPNSLPSGVIHGDLFPDNIFFQNDTLSGIIDFYFACNDFYVYDLAICINSWCFEQNNELNVTKTKRLLSSYNKIRQISDSELDAIPVLASGAAIRFLLTRLIDWFSNHENALVVPKDPVEYLEKIRFHKGIESYKKYGI